ncbi:MAG: CIA30 family protein [Rhodospirillales bacterium]
MLIIDDFAAGPQAARAWRAFSDRVMGGVSEASVVPTLIDGRTCLRLTGDVRLENNGGFVQMARDLAPAGETLDASAFAAVALLVRGNGESYGCHLRTPATARPWQSYRATFRAGGEWREVILPFADFVPHRLDAPLDVKALRRIGLVAIGRAFAADLALARLALVSPLE